MIRSKKLLGLSIALTLVFSSVMLMKSLLFSPRKSVVVKTENSGLRTWESKENNKEPFAKEALVQEMQTEAAAEEAVKADAPEASADDRPDKKININTASAKELEALPGIGESLAKAVLACREEIGGFETIEDIMKVSGIGPAKFKAMAELITVGDR